MNEKSAEFDLDDPKLPKSIRKAAITSGGYPYAEKLDKDDYEEQLQQVWLQLALLQEHVARTLPRIVIIFEGRDAAGKGGTIRRYLAHLNPRYNLHVALPKPNDRERSQWYFQRYVDWLPAGGETVLFDRSWYNRAGVEPVMGFCTEEETTKFLRDAPRFEHTLVDDGIHLIKFFMVIGREMQMKRFHDRRHDPLKRWKLSPVDLKAIEKYDDYSAARNRMFEATHTEWAPWTVIRSNDKRRARLNVIRSVLHRLDYDGKDTGQIGKIDPGIAMSAPDFLTHQEDA